MLDVRLRLLHALRFNSDSISSLIDVGRFTGQYIHTSAHRSLDFLLQAHEENMFKTLKNGQSFNGYERSLAMGQLSTRTSSFGIDGYHIAYLGPRGDTFAPGVTEMSVHEVSVLGICK
jgi:hypothetical protein